MSISKIVHYCWFGKSPKPKAVLEYIDGWREKLPDYEIIEWNESNFDISSCKYVKQAYDSKKYAFVSDYARLFALYNYGGIYLDTDVEIVKNLDPLLQTSSLTFGFEEFSYIATSTIISPKSSRFIKDFMDSYHDRSFINKDGSFDQTTNVQVLTQKLSDFGLNKNGTNQVINYYDETIQIVEQSVLSPFDYANYIDKSNSSTFTIHHYGQSWADSKGIKKRHLKKVIFRIIGGNGLKILRKVHTSITTNKIL